MPSEVSLAGQLMRQLHRYRAQSISSSSTARFFVTAIEEAVAVPSQRCQKMAAAAYCIDTFILFKLDELGTRAEISDETDLRKVRLTAAEQRWLNNVFPEVVRQVAMVEARLPVHILSYASVT